MVSLKLVDASTCLVLWFLEALTNCDFSTLCLSCPKVTFNSTSVTASHASPVYFTKHLSWFQERCVHFACLLIFLVVLKQKTGNSGELGTDFSKTLIVLEKSVMVQAAWHGRGEKIQTVLQMSMFQELCLLQQHHTAFATKTSDFLFILHSRSQGARWEY